MKATVERRQLFLFDQLSLFGKFAENKFFYD